MVRGVKRKISFMHGARTRGHPVEATLASSLVTGPVSACCNSREEEEEEQEEACFVAAAVVVFE